MRFTIALNFVLLAVCLARSQGQALNARGEIQARSDAPPATPATPSATPDASAKPSMGMGAPLPGLKDPKLCAMIVKRMKDFEAMSKGGGKMGATPPAAAAASKPAAGGASRRSRRNDIGSLNRRQAAESKDASAAPAAADPNACKEMETMLKAAREKMLGDIKKGMEAFAPKKDASKGAAGATDAPPSTPPADATAAPADAAPKTGATDAAPKTDDAAPKTGGADASKSAAS